MGATTAIAWTDATVNFWWGCTKVGPGCDFCYAESTDKRAGGDHWGLGQPRRKINGAPALIRKLDNQADRRRVFIQSMSDLFDLEVELDWFDEAWRLIVACDRLAIQICTKRVSAVEKRLAAISHRGWPQHAGLLVTVVDQAEADRDVPRLLALKEKLGIPWVGLSIEPMLGPIDLSPWIAGEGIDNHPSDPRMVFHETPVAGGFDIEQAVLDWVICGGESAGQARPMQAEWARSLRDQCAKAGVPFFFKQWGTLLPAGQAMADGRVWEPLCGSPLRGTKSITGHLLDGVEIRQFPKALS